jgi:hypothetical protein
MRYVSAKKEAETEWLPFQTETLAERGCDRFVEQQGDTYVEPGKNENEFQ